MLKIYLKVVRIILVAKIVETYILPGEIHEGKEWQPQVNLVCRQKKKCQQRIDGKIRIMSVPLHRKKTFSGRKGCSTVSITTKRRKKAANWFLDLVAMFQKLL